MRFMRCAKSAHFSSERAYYLPFVCIQWNPLKRCHNSAKTDAYLSCAASILLIATRVHHMNILRIKPRTILAACLAFLVSLSAFAQAPAAAPATPPKPAEPTTEQ